MSVKNTLLALIAIGSLGMSVACSAAPQTTQDSSPQGDTTQGTTSNQDSNTAGEPSGALGPSEADDSPSSDSASEDSATDTPNTPNAPEASGVSVTINGDDVEFSPTDVYCKVGGGKLRHLIAKTDNQPPLLEVKPGEFAMFKQQGKPEKTSSLEGMSYSTDGVVFDEAPIGNAYVNGTLECTSTQGE